MPGVAHLAPTYNYVSSSVSSLIHQASCDHPCPVHPWIIFGCWWMSSYSIYMYWSIHTSTLQDYPWMSYLFLTHPVSEYLVYHSYLDTPGLYIWMSDLPPPPPTHPVSEYPMYHSYLDTSSLSLDVQLAPNKPDKTGNFFFTSRLNNTSGQLKGSYPVSRKEIVSFMYPLVGGSYTAKNSTQCFPSLNGLAIL